jgi:hypothetical protein
MSQEEESAKLQIWQVGKLHLKRRFVTFEARKPALKFNSSYLSIIALSKLLIISKICAYTQWWS